LQQAPRRGSRLHEGEDQEVRESRAVVELGDALDLLGGGAGLEDSLDQKAGLGDEGGPPGEGPTPLRGLNWYFRRSMFQSSVRKDDSK
jgi:hypothetical protein